jgi:DNA-binding transcriptional LysR family regulator
MRGRKIAVNERQLAYFCAIAREGSITRAAEKLNIPQPHMSNQLKLLEEEIGAKLAKRSTRRFQLTDAGKQLQYRASQILDLIDITATEMKEFEKGSKGTVKIGTTQTPSSILLPSKLYQFYLKYPHIHFDVKTMQTHEIIEALKIGIIDIGITRTPVNHEIFDAIILRSYPMMALTSEDGLKDVDGDTIEITYLADKMLLLSNRLIPQVVEACRNAGFTPNIFWRIDDTRTQILCASLGMGMTLIQKDWMNLIPGLAVSYKELNVPTLMTSSVLISMKKKYLPAAAMNFLDMFKD